ncbi:hypothetical protein [Caulobacter sp. UNC279MFTsu5.1]|uniref:hypothetical protein n=1 Tax=Caulobacter sp. UNC279MFTsu5.1 TaxID=1502775 RepID=UPI0008EC07F9|nr:hypothetical protein [Caulobacter sp. UNC279MFTsu5.1]SFJ48356.1 hypothetical protein SAMN02799626_01904 [Caulobacter sp. UNC279MFTsu5.1]
MTRPWRARPILAAVLVTLAAAPSAAFARESLLARALSCRIDDGAVATLMTALAAEDAGMKAPTQVFAAPSGNLYRLTAPVGALGYSTDAVYVSPGRIAMVVAGQASAAVVDRLQLAPESYGPAERRIDDGRRIIAYQLHQGALDGKVLVGCAYDDPAALAWFADDMAGF